VNTVPEGNAWRERPLRASPCQKSTTLNYGWSYCGPYLRSHAPVIIDQLVDAVGKNGNYLLNAGLRADGSLPQATGPENWRRQIEHTELLGSTNSIPWEWNETGLKLHFSQQRTCDHAFVNQPGESTFYRLAKGIEAIS
jgi:hypothetical protein